MTEKTADYILAPSVTLAAAQRALAAALEEARNVSIEVCVAVTDSAGHLLAFARMDRAPILSSQIAQDKAYSVATFGGLPTSEWWALLESDPPLRHGIVKTERLIVFGGGVPLVADGRIIGGIGVSGGSSDQDVQIAKAGAAVIALAMTSPIEPGGKMNGLESFDLEQLDKLTEQARPYHEFLRRRGMSLGIYVLPVGGTDNQHPHASDEVYIVQRGRGTLRVRDQNHEVRPGSIISVDHGEEHRFVDIAEDLHILVVFAPPDDPD